MDVKSPRGSMAFGLDHAEMKYVSSLPPRSPATQNQLEEHETDVRAPPGSTVAGGDQVEPLNLSASP